MRTIKRQCSIFKTGAGEIEPQMASKKKDRELGMVINRKTNLPLKSSTSIVSNNKEFQAKANEAADFIKDKRM